MLGKTHATIGAVAGLAIMQPHDLTTLVIGGAVAMAGALYPDLDAEHSMAQQGIKKIINLVVVTVAVGLGIGWLNTYHQIDIQMQLPSIANVGSLNIVGGILLLAFGIFGVFQKHRTIMHSLLAMIIATFFAWMFAGWYGIYFGIGYASHLILDILNFQSIQLLYPLEKRFSLKLCKSNGTVNTALFVLGIVAVVELSAYLLTGQLIA